MSIDATRATAEGSPSLTRRLFLCGSASVAAVAGVAVAPAVAESIGPYENPELMRLDAEFRAAHADYLVAEQARQAARARFAEICPPVPEIIVFRGPEGRGLCQREVDCEGKDLWPDCTPARLPRSLASSELVKFFHGDDFTRTRLGRRMKMVHDAAEAYEEARRNALKACGIGAAVDHRENLVDRLQNLASAIMDQEAYTPIGLVAKAFAFMAYAGTGAAGSINARCHMSEGLVRDMMAVLGGMPS